MTDITFITDKRGEKVAAVVPIKDWKKLKKTYRKIKKDEAEEEDIPEVDEGENALFYVEDSPIHGKGVFAKRKIKKGTPIIEYKGKRISSDDADEEFGDNQDGEHYFTVLFSVDDEVIDASIGGNDARFINHSCDPNCEAIQYGSRIFIEAIRDIKKDEELAYDYHLQVEKPHTKKKLKQYACHCGSKKCRGTQVELD